MGGLAGPCPVEPVPVLLGRGRRPGLQSGTGKWEHRSPAAANAPGRLAGVERKREPETPQGLSLGRRDRGRRNMRHSVLPVLLAAAHRETHSDRDVRWWPQPCPAPGRASGLARVQGRPSSAQVGVPSPARQTSRERRCWELGRAMHGARQSSGDTGHSGARTWSPRPQRAGGTRQPHSCRPRANQGPLTYRRKGPAAGQPAQAVGPVTRRDSPCSV